MIVACAVPSGRSWQPAMGACFASMCTLAASDGIGIGILSLHGTWVAQSRISLVKQAINNGADYILFVDDDMVFPPDSIHRLLSHQREIVGVLYAYRGPPFGQVGLLKDPSQESGLAEATYLGTGLMMIHLSVFSRIEQPWFLWTELRSDDAYFVEKSTKAGITAWCDLDLSKEIGHIGTQMFTLGGFKPEIYGVKDFRKVTDHGQQNGMDSR